MKKIKKTKNFIEEAITTEIMMKMKMIMTTIENTVARAKEDEIAIAAETTAIDETKIHVVREEAITVARSMKIVMMMIMNVARTAETASDAEIRTTMMMINLR